MITSKQPQLPEDIARHYDELDPFYRALWGEHLHHGLWRTGSESPEQAVQQLTDYVVEQAQIHPGNTVCDIGCGYGATARRLAARYRARVTALTISEHQYRYARNRASGQDSVTVLHRDWLVNQLPEACFDAAIAIESLAHMADKPRALAEAYRVLRPGGRLVICTWQAAEWPAPWAVRHVLEPICREGRLAGLPSALDYHRWLLRAGFTVRRYEDLSRHVRRTWDVCLRRVAGALLRKPEYWHYLLDAAQRNRHFVFTLPRLWFGYRTGAFRYGLFVAEKSQSTEGDLASTTASG